MVLGMVKAPGAEKSQGSSPWFQFLLESSGMGRILNIFSHQVWERRRFIPNSTWIPSPLS
jgi:hypothetical protein